MKRVSVKVATHDSITFTALALQYNESLDLHSISTMPPSSFHITWHQSSLSGCGPLLIHKFASLSFFPPINPSHISSTILVSASLSRLSFQCVLPQSKLAHLLQSHPVAHSLLSCSNHMRALDPIIFILPIRSSSHPYSMNSIRSPPHTPSNHIYQIHQVSKQTFNTA